MSFRSASYIVHQIENLTCKETDSLNAGQNIRIRRSIEHKRLTTLAMSWKTKKMENHGASKVDYLHMEKQTEETETNTARRKFLTGSQVSMCDDPSC